MVDRVGAGVVWMSGGDACVALASTLNLQPGVPTLDACVAPAHR